MKDKSYAVYERNIDDFMTISQIEDFCLQARMRGANNETRLTNYFSGSWKVNIPEDRTPNTFKAPDPKPPVISKYPPAFWWIIGIYSVITILLAIGAFL